MNSLSDYLLKKKVLVDQVIAQYLPNTTDEPRSIHECMSYSTNGGKRLRPIITLAVSELLDCPAEKVLPTCAAIEFIHTHSLILDDMPCMDNDDYRRGRPAAHKLFGEGIALLAADALLNLAIAILGANHRLASLPAEIALDIINDVGETVGTNGMIGAQAADLSFSWPARDVIQLERIHLSKTAKLFGLCARTAARIADCNLEERDAVNSYAENLGLAFQIVDDILDQVDGDNVESGNRRKSEPSYVAAFGAERARALADLATEKAVRSLSIFGDDADTLRLLARYNVERQA